jgi:hypothetical protein
MSVDLFNLKEKTPMAMERQINMHHDGHGLNESITIEADGPGPGGASHTYIMKIGEEVVCHLQFQNGPRNVEGSIPGVTEQAVLAALIDRIKSFQAGKFACRENAIVITHLETAMLWSKERTNERARRAVLGTMNT